MKRLLLLIILLLPILVRAQTPSSPVQLTTNTPYLEPSTGLHWYYNGGTYLWYKSLGVKDSTYYITPYYANHHFAPIGSGVTSIFGRTGAVTAQTGDYSAFYPILAGSYTNPAWITSLAWSKITGTPTTLSGYGITDGITLTYFNANTGASTQAQIDGKQATGNYIIALTGEATASGPGSASVTLSNTAVIGKVLTGYTSGAGTVSASDNILQAIQKLNGNAATASPVNITISAGTTIPYNYAYTAYKEPTLVYAIPGTTSTELTTNGCSGMIAKFNYSSSGLTTLVSIDIYGNDDGTGHFNEDTWVKIVP